MKLLKPSEGGRLYAFDQDLDAVEAVERRLRPYKGAYEVIRANYRNAAETLRERGVERVDGVLLDLGVSSHQMDSPERGFSYRADAALDMRMDQRTSLTAYDVVNGYSEEDLKRVIRDYGEERYAARIAKHIAEKRSLKPIESTLELAELVKEAIPTKNRQQGRHPARRTFQAVRIEVNQELEVLEASLEMLTGILGKSGRLAIITFHSLEDRIVKKHLKVCENPCICPPGFPVCVCGRKPIGHTVNRKPIVPSEEEIELNPRSRSAKLRIFEKY